MSGKQSVPYTFHKVREQCEQGTPAAWRAFLDLYAPLWFQLLAIYLPGGKDAAPGVVQEMVVALGANQYERFRATSRQSEREFLTEVRALLLDIATGEPLGSATPGAVAPETVAQGTAASVGTAPGEAGGAETAAEGVATASSETPAAPATERFLMHQEMLFCKLAGYTNVTIERMTRIAPSIAEKSFERLAADYAAALAVQQDRCPWPAEWLRVLREARAAKAEKCPPQHQFLRIHDGQVSWYDKEPVERHVAGCLHCLESWTALREVAYWRREAPAIPEAQIAALFQALPAAGTEQKKSLLRRVFG
jgi:hypothetical protein